MTKKIERIFRKAISRLGRLRKTKRFAQDAGVSQIVVSRFMSGERDIRMATADKLAEVLGLKVASSNEPSRYLLWFPAHHSRILICSPGLGSCALCARSTGG